MSALAQPLRGTGDDLVSFGQNRKAPSDTAILPSVRHSPIAVARPGIMILPVDVLPGDQWLKGELNDAKLFLLSRPERPDLFYMWTYRLEGLPSVRHWFRFLRTAVCTAGFEGLITETITEKTREWGKRTGARYHKDDRCLLSPEGCSRLFGKNFLG